MPNSRSGLSFHNGSRSALLTNNIWRVLTTVSQYKPVPNRSVMPTWYGLSLPTLVQNTSRS
ncbi:Uncharacterised protein [Vibrio cholerae]|nr:Uncharacterised protein [Vibrio cholerae]CSH87173.1 Uncharacterised protein [Vibrio cholerae]